MGRVLAPDLKELHAMPLSLQHAGGRVGRMLARDLDEAVRQAALFACVLKVMLWAVCLLGIFIKMFITRVLEAVLGAARHLTEPVRHAALFFQRAKGHRWATSERPH